MPDPVVSPIVNGFADSPGPYTLTIAATGTHNLASADAIHNRHMPATPVFSTAGDAVFAEVNAFTPQLGAHVWRQLVAAALGQAARDVGHATAEFLIHRTVAIVVEAVANLRRAGEGERVAVVTVAVTCRTAVAIVVRAVRIAFAALGYDRALESIALFEA